MFLRIHFRGHQMELYARQLLKLLITSSIAMNLFMIPFGRMLNIISQPNLQNSYPLFIL